MTEPIRYHVGLSRRTQHLVDVTVVVPADLAAGARLVLPTWTPGSYVIRDYAHHVQSVSARGPEGSPIALTPDGTTAWRLPDDVAGPATVAYELYANDLTVRTNHVDDHHALLVAPATFPFVDGATDRPHEVRIDAAPVWSLLPEAADGAYLADDYDHLADSAFEVGDHPCVDVEVAGTPHRFVWSGHGGRPDLERIGRDVGALATAAIDLFDGDLPVERYTFLCVGWDAGGGGLEHRDGAVLQAPVRTFQDADAYARFQSLLAHEYLHLWNVKRLVPADLMAIDRVRPTHSTSLWVAEGWTAYYDELLPARAGVWTVRRLLDRVHEQAEGVLRTPGTALQSVREASYHAWTKLYVRDENSPNAGTDYYAHGALLAWCLDLLIRREAPDGPGLDGALRTLWRRFGGSGHGYTEADVERAVADAAGRDLSGFFAAHVEGRELPPIWDLVDVVGLERVDDEGPTPAPPELGVQTSENGDGVTFSSVLRDGPAWTAGLSGGDRLLAIDGLRVRRGELETALRAYEAGETVEVAVFRGPRLLTLPVTLGPPRPRRRLRPLATPDDRQRAAFRGWTGRELDAAH